MRIKQNVKSAFSISALLLVVLFKFQNCAPAPEMAATSPVADRGGDTQVRIVDSWAEGKIAFLNSSQKITTGQTTVNVQGLCVGSARGEKIQFQVLVLNEIPQMISAGEVECSMGGFEVHLEALNFQSCAEKLQVRAARVSDTSAAAETLLLPECSGS